MSEKKTWRHWINEIHGYHLFKNFKVYWAYRLMQKEQIESEVNEIKIDRILLDNGWERQNKDFSYYSTVGDLVNIYTSNGKQVTTGLHDLGYPPTLIRPLPLEVIKAMENDRNKQQLKPESSYLIDLVQSKSEQEISEWLKTMQQ